MFSDRNVSVDQESFAFETPKDIKNVNQRDMNDVDFLKDINFPQRGALLLTIPVFCKVRPLQRPRVNRHTKTIYQPEEDQNQLKSEIYNYIGNRMLCIPVIVDEYYIFKREGKDDKPWPTKNVYGDEDNLRKAVNDALQVQKNVDECICKIIADDNLIVGGEQFKIFGDEDMGIIKIWEIANESVF